MATKKAENTNEVMLNEDGFFTYKGKPLVRKGNTIYYGDMSDNYVAMLEILDTKEESGVNIATKVSIKVMNTDPTVSPLKMIFKSGEQPSLYEAIDIAGIWLERALRQEA